MQSTQECSMITEKKVSMSQKLHIVSLGCSKNLVDTEVMLGRLQHMQLTNSAQEADVIIVNTCGFIDVAKEESLQTVLQLHDQRKQESLLVMAGCLSERYKEELQKELGEVDLFTGVGDYAQIDTLLKKKKSTFSAQPYLIDNEARVVTGSSYHAYIKIAEGCNQQCSFCAIPSFKGKLHSRTIESIVREVQSLCEQGYFDFTFVSQDSSSFLRDEGVSDGLIALIDAIEAITAVKSARILYLYPSTTSIALIDRIAASNTFHNYFDMPLQHTQDNMLTTMRRGLNWQKSKALLLHMKKQPNSFIRTSVIVGHPGESRDDFTAMQHELQQLQPDRLTVFEYSDEEQTAAFLMPQKVDAQQITERINTLQSDAKALLHASLDKMIGQTIDVIIDGTSSEHELFYSAKALFFAPEIDGEILINDASNSATLQSAHIYQARITQRAGEQLLATIIDN